MEKTLSVKGQCFERSVLSHPGPHQLPEEERSQDGPKKSYQDCWPRIRRVKARKSKESIARLEILDQAVQVLKDEGLASEAKQLKSWLKRLNNSKSSSFVSESSVLSQSSAVVVIIFSNHSVNRYRKASIGFDQKRIDSLA